MKPKPVQTTGQCLSCFRVQVYINDNNQTCRCVKIQCINHGPLFLCINILSWLKKRKKKKARYPYALCRVQAGGTQTQSYSHITSPIKVSKKNLRIKQSYCSPRPSAKVITTQLTAFFVDKRSTVGTSKFPTYTCQRVIYIYNSANVCFSMEIN